MIVFYFLAVLISIVLAALLIPKVLVISYKKQLFDLPSARKVHNLPIPRLGGITFFPIVLITFCLLSAVRFTYFRIDAPEQLESFFFMFMLFFVGMTILFLVGVADDLVAVSYRYKFLVQILAAALFPASGLYINNLGGIFGIYEIHWALGYALTIFLCVYVTNAINLIDGIDGLASGLSLISLSVFSLLCFIEESYIYMILLGSIFGVLLVFFLFNVFGRAERKHKIFMGDTGSLILGYIISFMLVHFMHESEFYSPWKNGFAMIALSSVLVPLFDVIRIVISRLRSHRHPFLPDKNHIHHKVLRTGLGRRATMLTILGISFFFIIFNTLLVRYVNYAVILILDLAIWVGINITINYFIRRHEHTHGGILHIGYEPPHEEQEAIEREKEENV